MIENVFSALNLIKGRTDRKFCNDQCRGTYHNLQYLESNTAIRLINRILKKNYSILSLLNTNGKTTVSKIQLHYLGYRFEYVTSMSKTRNNNVCFFCYNQGYRELNDKVMMLVLPFKKDNLA
jgi:hypothetical protein